MIVREQQVDSAAEQACSGEAWSIVAAAFIAGFVVFGTIY